MCTGPVQLQIDVRDGDTIIVCAECGGIVKAGGQITIHHEAAQHNRVDQVNHILNAYSNAPCNMPFVW